MINVPDRTLVSSPKEEVFAIEVGRRRQILDADTRDALLAYNQSKNIQKKILKLTDEDLKEYAPGPNYPPRRTDSVFIGNYGSNPESRSVYVADGWQRITNFTIGYQGKFFSANAKAVSDSTGRVTSVLFTAVKGEGNCYVMQEPRSHGSASGKRMRQRSEKSKLPDRRPKRRRHP